MPGRSLLRLGLLAAVCASTAAGCAGTRYNDVRQRSSHNAYQKTAPIGAQLEKLGVRSLELDIHRTKLTASDLPGDWHVYHHLFDQKTSCAKLSTCLDEIARFHRAQPRHDVLTVWLDVKDAFERGHDAVDLDRMIASHIPMRAIYRPRDRVRACDGAQTLQDTVSGSCEWPQVDDLRGKVIFVLTDGDSGVTSARLDEYTGASRALAGTVARLAFVAPRIESPRDIDLHPQAVFFNLDLSHVDIGAAIFARGLVSRVYGVTSSSWARASAAHVHHLATDEIETEMSSFQCLAPPCSLPATTLYGAAFADSR